MAEAKGFFKTELTLGQAVGFIIIAITSAVGSYVAVSARLTAVEIRVEMLEKQQDRAESYQREIIQQLTDIKVALSDKVDKTNR